MKPFRNGLLCAGLWILACRIWAIEAFVQPCVFFTPNTGAYAEIRLFIHPKGFVAEKQTDSLISIRAELTFMLRREGSIIRAEKMMLSAPPAKSPGPLLHQLRWSVEPGRYELETRIADDRDSTRELTLINEFEVRPKTSSPMLSDLQLCAIGKASADSSQVLYKNGMYSEPLSYHHLPAGLNLLYVYLESYGATAAGDKYVLHFSLARQDSSGLWNLVQEWYKRRESREVDPYFLQHDVSSQVSGNYRLSVRLMNIRQEIFDEREILYTRENPFWDHLNEKFKTHRMDKAYFDTLSEPAVDYAIRAMYPLMSSLDRSVLNDLFRKQKLEEKRLFLFGYWSEKSDTARASLDAYLQLAGYVDQLFYSGFGRGFETDRGYIYLKYGRPDEVIAEDKDNGAFPYEIWKYAKIGSTGQTNVKFLFYNPDLAGSDFRLLHSTARGERENKRWEIELYRNAADEFDGDNAIDATEIKSGYNRRAREYFDN